MSSFENHVENWHQLLGQLICLVYLFDDKLFPDLKQQNCLFRQSPRRDVCVVRTYNTGAIKTLAFFVRIKYFKLLLKTKRHVFLKKKNCKDYNDFTCILYDYVKPFSDLQLTTFFR